VSVRDVLTLTTVAVSRSTRTADGMGGGTLSTASTVLGRAAIWSAGASKGLISDQLMAVSSHILVCLTTDDVLFTDQIVYDGVTYDITGHPDDVMMRGDLKVVPLKRVN